MDLQDQVGLFVCLFVICFCRSFLCRDGESLKEGNRTTEMFDVVFSHCQHNINGVEVEVHCTALGRGRLCNFGVDSKRMI